MLCPNCETDALTEDDATGQLICLECGVGTGVFEGLTQSQEFMETRGLRVVGSVLSQPTIKHEDSTVPQSQPNGLLPTMNGDQAEPAGDFPVRSLPSSDDEMAEIRVTFVDQTTKPKKAMRSWRISEPFTYIMRKQAVEFSQLLGLDDCSPTHKRFLDSVWRLWLNYLAITGELGENAWHAASRGPGRALQTLLQLAKIRREQKQSARAREKAMSARSMTASLVDDWTAVHRRLDHYLWVGWGPFYEPNEGRLTNDPFLVPLQRAHAKAMHNLKRKVLRSRMSAPLTSRSASSKTPRESGITVRKRRRSCSSNSKCSDVTSGSKGNRRRRSKSASSSADSVLKGDEADLGSIKSECPTEANYSAIPAHDLGSPPHREASQSRHQSPRNSVKNAPTLSGKRQRLLSRSSISDQGESITIDNADPEKPLEIVEDEANLFTLRPITLTAEESLAKLLNLETLDAFSNDPDGRSAVWREYVIDKLSKSNPWKRVYWSGQIPGAIQHRCLVEHNLSLLFLAQLTIHPTREAVNPIAWPHEDFAFLSSGTTAIRRLVTLNEMVELARTGRLTCLSLGHSLPPGLFAIHDQNLSRLFYSKQSLLMDNVVTASVSLVHLLGFYQLPKFPLIWLVYRHLLTLGLPDALRDVCRLLLRRFAVMLNSWNSFVTGPTLVPFIPWPRLLRVEVIAMAVVVIALRLVFKFDNVSEHRLSMIAKATSSSEVTSFDVISWSSYISKRFHSGEASSQAPLILSASSDDLDRLSDVTAFLGSTEFKPGESRGWGEGVMYPRKHAQPESKFALSRPLRDLLTNPHPSVDSTPSQAPASPPKTADSSDLTPVITQSMLDGFRSPFRTSHVDFLLNPDVNPDQWITANSPAGTDWHVLVTWWRQLIRDRSNYRRICTESWFEQLTKPALIRCRVVDTVLPGPVERLIRRHDDAMSRAFQPGCQSCGDQSAASEQGEPTPPTNGETETPPATESQPGRSIRWLVELCSRVCGLSSSSSSRLLLREIQGLESLLFDPAAKSNTSKSMLANLALYSCLDLNDLP